MENAYILFDPQHVFAVELMRAIKDAKPIFIYSSRANEFVARQWCSSVKPNDALRHYYLDETTLKKIALEVMRDFNIVAVIPHYEKAIRPTAELLRHLDLKWNNPDTLELFRNKGALKEHLRQQGARVNYSRIVRSAGEVFNGHLPDRFVIKPNDGFANRDVGFFNSSTTEETIKKYFAGSVSNSFILEEFLQGKEYAINGQMDENGKCRVVAILNYERISGNGKPNLYWRSWHVRTTAPEWEGLVKYVSQTMEASGLVRSPFHAEVIYTEHGPSLIEVAARLGGNLQAMMANDLHGGNFNYFDLAGHYYLHSTAYAGSWGNWGQYDGKSAVVVDGVNERGFICGKLNGIDEIEKLPEFGRWTKKPIIGSFVPKTIDMLTASFGFYLIADGIVDIKNLAIKANNKIKMGPGNFRTRAKILTKRFGLRVYNRMKWELIKRFKL